MTSDYRKNNHEVVTQERWKYSIDDNGERIIFDMFSYDVDADDDGRPRQSTVSIVEDGTMLDPRTDVVSSSEYFDACERRAALMAAAPTMFRAIDYALKHIMQPTLDNDVESMRRLRIALNDARPYKEWPRDTED